MQIIAGILGAMVFLKSFLNYGEVTITMTIISFFTMVFGLAQGLRSLYTMYKH